MKRLICGFAVALAALAFGISQALAQSSGNIATNFLSTVCEISSSDGSLSCIDPSTGNAVACPTLSGGSGGAIGTPLLSTTIQTPSGSGTGLVITPSLDTGLFTKTKVSSTSGILTGTDTAETGLLVQVTIDGNPVPPEVQSTDTTNFPGGISGVMYDERFQQLSTNNIACGTTAGCSIQLILSSLSAHSFNFVAPNLTQGNHTVNVYAQLVNTQGSEEACVGPGSLTAVQVKAFQQN